MIEEIDLLIEHMKSLAERMPTTGDMADVDLAIMSLRHVALKIRNREESK
jgi:hypothetical protein